MSPNGRVHVPHQLRWRWLVAAVIFAAFVWNEARAENVSGIYQDAGNTAPGDPQQAAIAVSLQALLTLEFDPTLASPSYSPATRVEVTQTDTFFRIICRNSFGTETWSGQWKAGEGYGVEPGQVKLVFRSKRHAPDAFFFLLRPAGEDKLLVVEVQRVTPTSFGPSAKLQGLYVFERVPPKMKGSAR